MSIEPQRAAYAVIPAYILFNTELSDGDKIIYGHISNLCNMYGFCWASNGYLAELTGKSIETVKRAIKALKDNLCIEIEHEPNGEQDQRKIYLSKIDFAKQGGRSKMTHPQVKNDPPGGSKMTHIIYKEEYSKENNLKEPPPPIASSPKDSEPPAPQAPAAPAGGGGGSEDLIFKTTQGKERSLSSSEIYRYMLKYPQFTTDIIMEAIEEAREVKSPVNEPFSYLVGICSRIMQKKNRHMAVPEPKVDSKKPKEYEPGVNVGELMKKMKQEEIEKRKKEANNGKP